MHPQVTFGSMVESGGHSKGWVIICKETGMLPEGRLRMALLKPEEVEGHSPSRLCPDTPIRLQESKRSVRSAIRNKSTLNRSNKKWILCVSLFMWLWAKVIYVFIHKCPVPGAILGTKNAVKKRQDSVFRKSAPVSAFLSLLFFLNLGPVISK